MEPPGAKKRVSSIGEGSGHQRDSGGTVMPNLVIARFQLEKAKMQENGHTVFSRTLPERLTDFCISSREGNGNIRRGRATNLEEAVLSARPGHSLDLMQAT